MPVIEAIRRAAAQLLAASAEAHNARGIKSPRGRRWLAAGVCRMVTLAARGCKPPPGRGASSRGRYERRDGRICAEPGKAVTGYAGRPTNLSASLKGTAIDG